MLIRARVAGVRVHAIIDTGGQATIGNEAMRDALLRRRGQGTTSPVTDVTATTQSGESFPSPPIELGTLGRQRAQHRFQILPAQGCQHDIRLRGLCDAGRANTTTDLGGELS